MFNEIDKYVTTLIKNKTEKRQIINLKTEINLCCFKPVNFGDLL